MLVGEKPHRFDLRFHLAPDAWEKVDVAGNTVRAPGVTLVFSQESRLQIEPGWFAPLYGVKQNAPVVRAVIEGTSSAEFVTVIMPSDPVRQVPELKIFANSASALAIEISGTGPEGSSTDYVAWSASVADHDIALVQCRASAVWSRSSRQMADARFVACNVQECLSNQDNRLQFTAPSQPAAWINWDLQHGLTNSAERFE